MYKLLFFPAPELAQPTVEVTEFDTSLHELLDAMASIMKQHKGLGLSANQVGSNKRVFIMLDKKTDTVHEFVNPSFTAHSSGTVLMEEGCLSFPGVTVQVTRGNEAFLKAKNRNGEDIEIVAQDLEAVCIYHEMDHLNGKTFLDRTTRQQRRAAQRKLGV